MAFEVDSLLSKVLALLKKALALINFDCSNIRPGMSLSLVLTK